MSVRWDAVIDRAARVVDTRKAPPPVPCLVSKQLAGCVQVHVQLFGALASASAERLIQLELPTTATIADVVATLGERLGKPFLAVVQDGAGRKHRHCRLFVDGYPVEDMTTLLNATARPTQVEIILLIAPEGG
jgi:hypothetical protein